MNKSMLNNKGFTLVELILTLLLIGILAVAVLPRLDIGIYRDDTAASLFLSHLRFAQHRAMVTGGGWHLSFTATSYSLFDETGTSRLFPDGSSTIDVTAINSNRTPLYFDSLGAPDNDANSHNTNGVNTQTIISIGGQTITIEPHTGGVL